MTSHIKIFDEKVDIEEDYQANGDKAGDHNI